MDFAVDIDYYSGLLVAKVRGDVDIYSSTELDERLRKAALASNSRVVIDLSESDYFDSDGLKVLIGVWKSLGSGRKLTIVGATGIAAKVFDISGLDSVFEVLPSLDSLMLSVAESKGVYMPELELTDSSAPSE